jgi:hypothetical protein
MNTMGINTNFPDTRQIMATPAVEPTSPLVPSPVDHNKVKLSIAPNNQWYTDDTFCNVLPPAPRSQLINYPTSKKNCPKYKSPKYNPKKCYFTYNEQQNIPGIFCGGEDNANFVRGNQFSNECGKNYQDNSKKNMLSIGNNILSTVNPTANNDIDEYSLKATKPVQTGMEEVLIKDNPTVISDSPFYPYPNYNNTKNKKYIEYPHAKHYTDGGMPLYTYPYNTLTKSPVKTISEHFSNGCGCKNKNGLYIGIFVILILLIIAMVSIKR